MAFMIIKYKYDLGEGLRRKDREMFWKVALHLNSRCMEKMCQR